MSNTQYVPEVGDEVEVVLRGKVGWRQSVTMVVGNPEVVGSVLLDLDSKHVASVTRVRKPLPTEPGHVVMANGAPYLRDAAGWWDAHTGCRTEAAWLAEQDWRIVSVPVQDGEAK